MGSNSHYVLLPSAFGVLGIVWRETGEGPSVHRILLPNEQAPLEDRISATAPHPTRRSCAPITELGERIRAFLAGQEIDFELNLIALDECSEFQQSVLLAEHGIPRGWVSTYGRIAKRLEVEGGARAVGNALARNPFPIVIPCHRAIRSNGELGGYQGGPGMKRALLEMEGVKVSKRDKIVSKQVY